MGNYERRSKRKKILKGKRGKRRKEEVEAKKIGGRSCFWCKERRTRRDRYMEKKGRK